MVRSNLEPIDESDLDLKNKLKEGDVGFDAESKEQPAFAVEKEAPREVIAAEKDAAYDNILAKVQTQSQNDDAGDVSNDAQTAFAKTDAESQVQHLVDIAMQKGVVHAVKVARHMEDNFVLDSFHDRLLADDLHAALVQKGLLKEI